MSLNLSNRARFRVSAVRSGFTLVELLVVIGIIALLISILLPSLAKAREQGIRTKCLANIKSLGMGIQMYANENRSYVCAVNWGDSATGNGRVKAGWLYSAGAGLYPNFNGTTLTEQQVEEGALWPYVKVHGVYRCPGHDITNIFGKTDSQVSYLMNGAMNSFDFNVPGQVAPTYPGKLYPMNKFKTTESVCIWEADERPGGASPFNDGASYPQESFNLNATAAQGYTSRHGKYSTICFLDGHAEFITHDEIVDLASQPGRNMLWCAPAEDRQTGH